MMLKQQIQKNKSHEYNALFLVLAGPARERVSLFLGGNMMKRLILLVAGLCILAVGTVSAYNPYAPNQFDAVERNTWEFKTAYSLAQSGLTGGDMTKFAPTYNLTRYELAEIVDVLIQNRSRANAEQQQQIDKLSDAFEKDLEGLHPQSVKQAEQPQGQKFDWKTGAIAK